MKKIKVLAITATLFVTSTVPLFAQDNDFNLTFHVERTPSKTLDLETCGSVVESSASAAGFTVSVQRFPQQLVLVSGGEKGSGVFTLQCIAVGDVTVSVVQGIDYRTSKGALGKFADDTYAAILALRK
ncbi:DUF6180 family protein [Ochrobactrum sp. EDr1-4]|uniref:DUF6180 family protein n=1 Tax=Ochrobactrum sp. EDr1-4 TaxID=3368622 RepID=UPI003BA278ED